MSLLLLILLAGETYHFSNATIYDAELNSIRSGVYLTVTDGRVSMISYSLKPAPKKSIVLNNMAILPHLTDFYTLIQDRGLGHDNDFSGEVQGRIGRYMREVGMVAFRDPVFPPGGLTPAFDERVSAMAMRGYLDLPNGPAHGFSLVVTPGEDPEQVVKQLPDGPVTLWWTDAGSDRELLWPGYMDYVSALVSWLQTHNIKVGAYVQDASRAHMDLLNPLKLDFYEGIPHPDNSVEDFPKDLIWVPLASLNDKRYCAAKLNARVNRLAKQNLYDRTTLTLVQDRMDSVGFRIAERCGVWKKRRKEVLTMVNDWLRQEGKVALGSGGGHLFSFSGDVLSELEALDGLGATQPQLLAAAFVHTPELLGHDLGYLVKDAPANFISWRQDRRWQKHIGHTVDFNFVDGRKVN